MNLLVQPPEKLPSVESYYKNIFKNCNVKLLFQK